MDEQKLLRKKRKAQLDNNNALLLSVCTDLSNLYMSLGKYDLAIEEYQILAKIYKSEKKNINFAQSTRGIAEGYIGLNKFEKALEHLQVYLDIARNEHDKQEEQRALATIGHTYLSWYLTFPENRDKNLLHKAYKMNMKSLVVCESLTNITKIKKADMIARLFNNLGVVQECLGNVEKAQELLTKSIQMCKQNDLYEQLNRGYMTMASSFEKMGDYKNVIANYNFAIEAAKLLKNKPEIMCDSLFHKAVALIKLGDFHGAKPVLYKAYKLKSPIAEENQNIERTLRIVAVMCKTEDQLIITGDNQAEVKKLYEKMADCACLLKNYTKGVDYYKKTLEAAEKSGASKKELSVCYDSLAQTYCDNGQYDEAVSYFEKEMEMYQGYKDVLNSLCKIADCKESGNASVGEIKGVYEKAIEICRKNKNLREEMRMVSRCLGYMRRNNHNSEACNYEKYLGELEERCNSEDFLSSSEAESETEAEIQSGNIGDDISLDNLTDMSDVSDNDGAPTEVKTARVKRKKNIIHRNIKGETNLHVAAIKGNLLTAQVLIDQGHPVNIRDHAGWLPLHEAANNGHLDIVKLLVENGSAINDRGDKQGLTPLHDAAYNGHIDIVEYLLDNGASAITMTDDGETPLQALQQWMNNNPIKPNLQEKYTAVIKRLTETMDKAGLQIKTTTTKNHIPSGLTLAKDKENIQTSQQRNFIKRNQSYEDFDLDDKRSKDVSDDGASEYRKVMANLKNKNTSKAGPRRISDIGTKRSALISVDDAGDDWLEDDLGLVKKKRKFGNKISPPTRKTIQRNTSMESHHSIEDNFVPDEFFNDFNGDNMEIEESSQVVPEERPSTSTNTKASQSSLMDSGFVHCRTPLVTTTAVKNKTPISANKTKSKQQYQLMLTNPRFSRQAQENISIDLTNSLSVSPEKTNPLAMPDPTLFVDVRIEGRLYRVPVLLSQVQTHTIKWLAEQAANRYASKEYMKPTLELETKNGAVLADEDLLSLLFPMGSMQAEQVEARVLKWSLPPLSERYRESCVHLNTDLDPTLLKLTEEMSDLLTLSNRGLRGTTIAPLTKAVNHQNNLLEINLSGNFLNTDCIKMLCASLSSLENLETLNLSCTGLQVSHVSMLANVSGSKRLSSLNLSDNLLKNESLPHLKTILLNFPLRDLNISAIGLKSDLGNVQLKLSNIESLNMSQNDISNPDLKSLLVNIDGKILKILNISRLRQTNSDVLFTLMEEVLNMELMVELHNIDLSRGNIEDTSLFNLLWHHTKHLTAINLSYNVKLTGLSLRRLLEHPTLNNINLIGCKNIFKNFENDVIPPTNTNKQQMTLKIFVDGDNESQQIINTFTNLLYPNFRIIVEQLPNYLHIKAVRS